MQKLRASVSTGCQYRSIFYCLAYLVSGLTFGTSLGCASDTFSPSVDPLVQQYWSATLNYHAVTLALTPPYNRLQLTLTPRQVSGAPLVASGRVVYTTSDTSVSVDSTGLLTAIAPARNVIVIAAMTIGGIHGVTNFDTVHVNVNDVSPVPRFTTLAIDPQPGDSARFTLDGVDETGNSPTITVTAFDASGNPISGVRLIQFPRNTDVLGYSIFGGVIFLSPNAVGQTWMYAEATVYGVTIKDSLLYTVTAARHSFVNIYPRTPIGSTSPIGYFYPQDDTIAVGGSIMWWNQLGGSQVADVVFDTPPGAINPPDSVFYMTQRNVNLPHEDGGNIPAFAPCDSGCFPSADTLGFRGRSFPTAGTYHYHSVLYHTTGVIHVVP